MTRVAAALIQNEDGRILACRRPLYKARGGLWEFVGGKVEPDETVEEALVRECKEELGVTVSPIGVFYEVTHRYPDVEIRLTIFRAMITEGKPQLLEHMEMRWVAPDALSELNFCPADKEILQIISEQHAKGLL